MTMELCLDLSTQYDMDQIFCRQICRNLNSLSTNNISCHVQFKNKNQHAASSKNIWTDKYIPSIILWRWPDPWFLCPKYNKQHAYADCISGSLNSILFLIYRLTNKPQDSWRWASNKSFPRCLKAKIK